MKSGTATALMWRRRPAGGFMFCGLKKSPAPQETLFHAFSIGTEIRGPKFERMLAANGCENSLNLQEINLTEAA